MARSITAIIKPTHDCNLRCRYCYVEDNAERGSMDSATLENMTRKLMTLPDRDRIHFIWHGGEPLLMGLDFYKQAVGLQKKYGPDKRVENGMQSNATLVDEAVLDFCEEYDFNIGSSLDGPEEIHDLTRVYCDGQGSCRGSFKDVWRGIQLIRARNEAIKKRTPAGEKPKHLGGGAITILTRLNIDRLDDIYNFFKANKISPKINPLIKSGKARVGYEDLGIGPAEYGQALVKLFDRWFYEEESGIDVDPLSTILGNLMTGKPVSCSFGESCRNSFISVGPKGDVYPCGRFDGVREYWLGNINEQSLPTILESKTHKMMFDRGRETVTGCSSCEYGKICNAGCMHNAYMQRGQIGDKDYYCASYKILFKHLETALNLELDKAVVSSEEAEKYRVEMLAKQTKSGEVCVTK